MRHTLFVYFFPLMHDRDVKIPNFAFYGGRKKQRRNSIPLYELGYGRLKFSFGRVRLHLTKYLGRNNSIKTERTQIHVAVASLDLVSRSLLQNALAGIHTRRIFSAKRRKASNLVLVGNFSILIGRQMIDY